MDPNKKECYLHTSKMKFPEKILIRWRMCRKGISDICIIMLL